MAKGIPVIGRAPDKKAKIINVDELGNLKVSQLESKLAAIESKLLALDSKFADGSAKVALSGTIMEYYGATVAQRPEATEVPVGAAYMAVNTGDVWQSNGFEWVVL